ncbi:hypothetical protein [Candidatus Korarchaeum cryptofilum]|uniref:hypothetical protein n=1 Tax=Candidatus Korarchaeum cryptofilum TaxID=498846 RepID=UPI000698E996|nr:hypothetical protein [Candidatus Korarchaeum cryptofilum]
MIAVMVIDWTDFPNPPRGMRSLDITEVRRVYDYELPPLVIYAGVAEDETGRVIPVVAILEEGTNVAKLYLFEEKDRVKEKELIASFA